MLSQSIKKSVETAVRKVLQELNQPGSGESPFRIVIEQPARLEHGDYSTNAAMQLAKTLRMSPLDTAALLAGKLQEDPFVGRLARKIEVVRPGFINLHMNWREWAHTSFSLPEAPGGKTVIEHTSINPNKSAHIGHLRNSCIGDTLGRLLVRNGYQIEIHNYIDDLGNQLADTVVGLLHVPVASSVERFGDFCWDTYSRVNKEYELNPELVSERSRVLHALEEGHNNLSWMGLLVAERIVSEHLEEMKQFNIGYDLLVWESSIVREGFWEAARELLKKTPLFVQEQEGKLAGCWVLKQSVEQAEDTADAEFIQHKVLVRSNGILTYTAKDIAYHMWKFGLLQKDFRYKPFQDELWTTSVSSGMEKVYGQADRAINVIDHRQEYPQAMVRQALEALGFKEQADKLRHVSYGVVSLSPAAASGLGIDTSDGKTSYAMSGRQGIGVKNAKLLELMEKVVEEKRPDKEGLSSQSIAAAAIRYYLLRFNLQTEVVFDMQQATEITGNTGVYLMYAYARSCKILDKAELELGIKPALPDEFPELEEQEHALLRQLAGWQDTLHAACMELSPPVICSYAYELASLFNHFYAKCPVLKAARGAAVFRIWLTQQFRSTLGDALHVLGLPAPERM
jgi:arginyl-tRNA synthetase